MIEKLKEYFEQDHPVSRFKKTGLWRASEQEANDMQTTRISLGLLPTNFACRGCVISCIQDLERFYLHLKQQQQNNEQTTH
jgi:hypothetical protein